MERDDRQRGDESQSEADQIVRNIIEPDEINQERLYGGDRTRSSASFPQQQDGRDGDRLAVLKEGKLWMCEKVRGKWHRQEFGAVTNNIPPAEETAIEVVNKAFYSYEPIPALAYGSIFVGDIDGLTIETTTPLIGEVRSRGNIYLNYDGPDADSYLYFYQLSSSTQEYLRWNDGSGRFEFSDNLYVSGSLRATSLYCDQNVRVGYNAGTDPTVFFYDDADPDDEYFMFDTSENEFFCSSPIRVSEVLGIPAGFSIVLDGGGAAIATGVAYDVEVPYDMTITQWTITSPTSIPAIVVDLWQDTYGNAPPTIADTITGANKPTLAGSVKAQTTGLSWALLAGSILRFNVDSVTNTQICTIGFIGTRA